MAEDEQELPGEEIVNEAGEVVTDLACVRCKYNLRGLVVDGKCPECGESIEEAVLTASEMAACLKCMHPNHPTQAVCEKCGAGMTAAAAFSEFWQRKPGNRVEAAMKEGACGVAVG